MTKAPDTTDSTTHNTNHSTNGACLSLIAPMFNEEAVLEQFFEQVLDVLAQVQQRFGIRYEIICVDDGSTDRSASIVESKAAEDTEIKLVRFSRNFGKEPAMSAALDYATGDMVIPIDVDLQDPPHLILEMVEKWQQGFDVVVARRASRATDSLAKRNTARWFYRIFNRLSEIDIPHDVGDFRLMDRRVVEVIKSLPEKDRFMKGLFSWPGFSQTTIDYVRHERAAGDSKFNFWQLWNFALSGITSFSTVPIRAGVYLGLATSIATFIYGILIITKTIITGVDVPGYASIMVSVLFFGGVQLFFLGLLGEYIGRIYKEVKNRPLYVVASTTNFNTTQESGRQNQSVSNADSAVSNTHKDR